ncbi:MAG: hypothetical protein IKS87_08640 [Lachnospiraceae bacterium]|nr:hypothetical protein [Lachnospiraceae bacterium]
MDANGMGGSNGLRQAPPPPPLPAGFKPFPVQGGMGAQGMNAGAVTQGMAPGAGMQGRQAPPPPPLPAGMHMAAPAQNAQPVSRHTAPMQGAALTRGAGRTSMSLADAEREKEQEELQKTAPLPVMEPVKQERVPVTGEACFARSPMDGLYYYATVSSVGEDTAEVTFFDEAGAQLPFAKILPVETAVEELQCFANYSGRGNYFPAQIDEHDSESVMVHYDENPEIREQLSLAMIRFAIR